MVLPEACKDLAAVVTSQPVAARDEAAAGRRSWWFVINSPSAASPWCSVHATWPRANGRPSNFPTASRHDNSTLPTKGSVDAAAAWVAARYGRCDALMNNAGVDYDTDAMAASADLARVHRAMETNLFGAWRTCLALLPLMRESPHGRIVNVSSEEVSLADMGAGTPAYHVTKAALNALTRTLAAELRDSAVLVNAVSPGSTATNMGAATGGPSPKALLPSSGRPCCPTTAPPAGSSKDGQQLAW